MTGKSEVQEWLDQSGLLRMPPTEDAPKTYTLQIKYREYCIPATASTGYAVLTAFFEKHDLPLTQEGGPDLDQPLTLTRELKIDLERVLQRDISIRSFDLQNQTD